MNEQVTVERCDPLLVPLLQASDPPSIDRLLAQLIQELADPIIAKILGRKLRVSLIHSQGDQENQDALEIASDLRATLIADLRALKERPDQRTIASFCDYVAIKTYSACADYFRRKHPSRWRLKDLLRYQLKQNPQFGLWKSESNHWYAGLLSWSGTSERYRQSPSSDAIREMFPMKAKAEVQPAELLTAIFEQSQGPIEFERLVALVAEIWDVTDAPLESVDHPEYEPGRESIDAAPRVEVQLEQRLYLEKLWTEVVELPVLQRAALLLNLRDAHGSSAIFFLPHLGIASHRQIAEALGLNERDFVMLWNELPLDDANIAQRLGVTRQQVINLRKTARERLVRRMEKAEAGGRGVTAGSNKRR